MTSGGYFDYNDFHIRNIAEIIQNVIEDNNSKCSTERLSKDTIEQLKETVACLNKAGAMAHRVDWLLSGNDDEQRFHEHLERDLKCLEQ